MDEFLGYNLKSFGVQPRTIHGLPGIITMHFIHGNWKHLINNSLAFFVLNGFLFYFYRSISGRVFIPLFFLSGVVLWIIGRPSNHIGASMLIYGLFAFLFFGGLMRKNPRLRRVSLFVAFYYGSMVWYIFPIEEGISWEGHLSGLFVGAILAWVYRRKGPPEPVYRYEIEPEPDPAEPYWMPDYGKQTNSNPVGQPSDDWHKAVEEALKDPSVKYEGTSKNDFRMP
jgi:membrane associated rhomboid family serine protease